VLGIGEARAAGDHFQYSLFCSQKGFGPFEVLDISVRSIPSNNFYPLVSVRHSKPLLRSGSRVGRVKLSSVAEFL
jgi:hypothetical protein